MVLKSKENTFSAKAFMGGIIIAIIIGLITSFIPENGLLKYSSSIYAVLIIIGIILGFTINIEGKNAQTFLLAGTILVIVSKFGMDSVTGSLIGIGIGNLVVSTFSALVVMFVPATIIVAVKTVYSLSRV